MAEYDERFNLRLDSKVLETLRKLSEKYRLPMSEIVRRFVVYGDRKILGDYEH